MLYCLVQISIFLMPCEDVDVFERLQSSTRKNALYWRDGTYHHHDFLSLSRVKLLIATIALCYGTTTINNKHSRTVPIPPGRTDVRQVSWFLGDFFLPGQQLVVTTVPCKLTVVV